MSLQEAVGAFAVLCAAGLFLYVEVRVLAGLLPARSARRAGHWTRHRSVRVLAGVGGAFACAACVDAFLIEPDWVVEERLTLKSPLIRKPVRIVQISDIHMEGFGVRHRRALEVVRRAQPDLVVLTGDYLNGAGLRHLSSLRAFVSGLRARLGVFAVRGNFDFSRDSAVVLREAGIRLLENESVRLDEAGVTVCGLACVWSLGECEKAFLARAARESGGSFAVVLSHYPNHVEEPSLAFADLHLCGHTHGGQVRLPFWGAIITLSAAGKKYECGCYRCGNTHVYVNRGLGMEGGPVPRVRFLCRPEVLVADILPADG